MPLPVIPAFPDQISVNNWPEKVTVGNFPKKIEVSNLREIKIPRVDIPKYPAFPKEIRISNLDDIKIPKFEIPKYPAFPKFPAFPKDFKVNNLPDIQKVDVVGGISFPKTIGIGGVGVTDSALDVNIKSGNVTLNVGDIQIGAVELKDGTTDARAPISATDGLLVNLGINNDVTAKLFDTTGAALDATYGGIYGLKVHIVGDNNKYVQGTQAEGDPITATNYPVLIGAEDNSGNLVNLQTNANKDLKITLDSEVITSNLGTTDTTNLAALVTELRVNNGAVAMQVDDAGSGVTYQGWAEPGTATSTAAWRIRKITATGADYSIQWQDGNRNFDNKWTERISAANYS
jgi:hypothetical protein